ncbi:hypothetical protein LCGC14_0879150 [marine sediment metagenome]|uniref:Uncharacterized protein n=1 Tax=marine sediment metagenome TaxID=412755 RepID=A0A0F9PN22_9ZZZZ
MKRYYITIKLNRPEDIGPVVELILSEMKSLCKVLVHEYIGELICFSVDTEESKPPVSFVGTAGYRGSVLPRSLEKKVRRLSRGKIRFKIVSTIGTLPFSTR